MFDLLVFPLLAIILSILITLVIPSILPQYFLIFAILTWIVSISAVFYVQRCFYIGSARYAPITLFLGGIIIMGVFVNSAFKTISGKGVTWKGRTYTTKN
jgi:hypothetical protein